MTIFDLEAVCVVAKISAAKSILRLFLFAELDNFTFPVFLSISFLEDNKFYKNVSLIVILKKKCHLLLHNLFLRQPQSSCLPWPLAQLPLTGLNLSTL